MRKLFMRGRGRVLSGLGLVLGVSLLVASPSAAFDFFADNPGESAASTEAAFDMEEILEEDWDEEEDEDEEEEDDDDWSNFDDVEFEDMEDFDEFDMDEDLEEDPDFELEGIVEEVPGKVYVFGKKDHYEFSKDRKYYPTMTQGVTYGTFSIAGDFTDFSDIDGVPLYEVGSGNVTFTYEYDDTRLKAGDDTWHLISDPSRKVDEVTLASTIRNGAFLVQTSKDREVWHTIWQKTNVFEDTPQSDPYFYKTTDVQILNGNYFRVLIVYELGVQKEDRVGARKFAEVYEFYMNPEEVLMSAFGDDQYVFEEDQILAQTGRGNGYSGNQKVKEDDLHYGWSLGSFYVTGFTNVEYDENENPIFYKEDGQVLSLWFRLDQDIDALGGNRHLKVARDKDGYDLFFNVSNRIFERGALIVGETDFEGKRLDPQVTTDFLEAEATDGFEIRIGDYEEGDYEVALDYMLEDSSPQIGDVNLIPSTNCYQQYFKFSVFLE